MGIFSASLIMQSNILISSIIAILAGNFISSSRSNFQDVRDCVVLPPLTTVQLGSWRGCNSDSMELRVEVGTRETERVKTWEFWDFKRKLVPTFQFSSFFKNPTFHGMIKPLSCPTLILLCNPSCQTVKTKYMWIPTLGFTWSCKAEKHQLGKILYMYIPVFAIGARFHQF